MLRKRFTVYSMGSTMAFRFPFLPSANEVVERKCFYTCLYAILFTEGGCISQDALGQTPPPLAKHPSPGRHPLGRHRPGRHPPRQTPPGQTPPAQCMLGYTPSPRRRPLLRTIRILLECIIVSKNVLGSHPQCVGLA